MQRLRDVSRCSKEDRNKILTNLLSQAGIGDRLEQKRERHFPGICEALDQGRCEDSTKRATFATPVPECVPNLQHVNVKL